MSSEKKFLHSWNSPVPWRLQLSEVAFISSWDLYMLKKNHFLSILPRYREQSNAHAIEVNEVESWKRFTGKKLHLKQISLLGGICIHTKWSLRWAVVLILSPIILFFPKMSFHLWESGMLLTTVTWGKEKHS